MARKPPPKRPPRARSAGTSDNAVRGRHKQRSGARPSGRGADQRGPSPGGKPAAPKRSGSPAPKLSGSPAKRAHATSSAARGTGPPSRETSDQPRAGARAQRTARATGLWLYGRHAVEAALLNPRRSCHRLVGTADALARLPKQLRRPGLAIDQVERDELDRRLGEGALHQGLALSAAPLPRLDLARACRPEPGTSNLVLLLDQIQDPHNLGAILRSAAAFEARAVIVPDHNRAPLGGVAAKASSGALDLVSVVEVTNLARALEELKELGYWRLALDGAAEATIDSAPDVPNLALVLGAEGTGVRRLVAERSDLRVRLPIAPTMESLNVSVACGIALYALVGHGARAST